MTHMERQDWNKVVEVEVVEIHSLISEDLEVSAVDEVVDSPLRKPMTFLSSSLEVEILLKTSLTMIS